MNSKKAAFMIGISMKAGKVASGEFAAEKAVKTGEAALLILAEDVSANTRKKFTNMASWYEVPTVDFLPKSELGRIIGKGERSCVAITDDNLAANIRKQLEEENTNTENDTQHRKAGV